ncbi:DUF6531 domain-containing protein [Psychrobacter pygoscelis]|uniref:DUF6531 domain-containing protein n=1 Tax=Psychrobacter pygoscelis TaxID=2488563 RepID=UPI00103DE523|nr:DUF6531 domain-containing protein [Psychrobacter pygoscelis]
MQSIKHSGIFTESITLHNFRDLSCPKDTYELTDLNGNLYCGIEKTQSLGCSVSVGNPCSVTTGNKFLSETDWSARNSPLKVQRFYNSLPDSESGSAAGWMHNYNISLNIGEVRDAQLNIRPQSLDEPNTAIIFYRGDGKRVLAVRNYTDSTIAGNDGWFINRDDSLKLTQINNRTWQVTNVKAGTVETYQALNNDTQTEAFDFKLTRIDYLNGQFVTLGYQDGNLDSVTDHFGQSLKYHYDSNGSSSNLSAITLPNGKQIEYQYNDNTKELQVSRPGFGTKTYLYDEPAYAPNPNGLITGIIDANGNRYATYQYDNQNRGISTEHADGSQKYTLSFHNGYTQVTMPHGGSRRYNLKLVSGANRVSAQSGNGKSTSNQYDQAGNLIRQSDNGLITIFSYDETRNLPTQKVTAFGTDESTITLIEWADDLPVKTQVTQGSANTDGTLKQALRVTSYTHDERGNTLTKTITDPITGKSRTWTYTYNDYSQKTSETNPLGLTQSWEYDPSNGNLLSVTDTQGLITTYSNHTSGGKTQTITQPSGQVTTLAYDDAGRITTQSTTITTPSLESLAKDKDGGIKFRNWWRKLFGMPLLPNPVKYDIKQTPTQTAVTTYSYDPSRSADQHPIARW